MEEQQTQPIIKKSPRLGRRTPKRKTLFNTLQKYIVIFLVLAVALLLLSWLFQSKLNRTQSIIADQQTAIDERSSALERAQSEIESLRNELSEAQQQIASFDAKSEELNAALELQTGIAQNDAHVIRAQLYYGKGDLTNANRALAKVDTAKLSSDGSQLYKKLKSLLK